VDPERVINAASNPEGRRVRLDDVTWNKIMLEHPEMGPELEAIMRRLQGVKESAICERFPRQAQVI
jgi:hypothetical protein